MVPVLSRFVESGILVRINYLLLFSFGSLVCLVGIGSYVLLFLQLVQFGFMGCLF